MKHTLLFTIISLALTLPAWSNGGPVGSGVRKAEQVSRGSAGVDERDLDSTSARPGQAKKRSGREAAQENSRNGSFPGSFGTIDRQEEELAPNGPKEFEDIKRDPYLIDEKK